jgi:hypothetical protein
MLEENYKTVCSITGTDIPMELDIKAMVDKILVESGMAEKRVAKMDNDDFLE